MADNRNLHRAAVFRERVELAAQGAGLAVKVRRPFRLPSEAMAADELSDVHGLRDWAIGVHANFRHDRGAQLDAALAAAQMDGKRWGASVEYRLDHEIRETYVTVSLATFLDVVTRLEAQPWR